MSERPTLIPRGDPDRCATVTAARGDRDVLVGHGANAERVNRAHRIDNAPAQRDPVARVLVREGIGADDPLAVENDQVASTEFVQ
jgi:hypothetical protein